MGNTYTAFREQGLPTYYPPNKTAVTADVLEIGFIFAFLIIFFSFIVILPGIRGMQVRVSHIKIDIESLSWHYVILKIKSGNNKN